MKASNALITGASRGLGRALAEELAARGVRVALVARNAAELHETVRAIRARGGVAEAIEADVSDKKNAYVIAGLAAQLVGPVDLLINNASTLGAVPLRALSESDGEAFEIALATNLLAPLRLTQAVLGSMLARGQGAILNISSDAAVQAYANWGMYAASKAALDHLTRVWAEELRDSPVRFLSIDPGEMDTQMHADAIPDADRSTLAQPADVARRIVDLLEAPLASGSRVVA